MMFAFKQAKREKVSLLIALAGASGSGKTYSALRLARGMSPSGKIAFIDTEARRGLHYAEEFNFMHADMKPPFRPERFIEGIHAAEAAGAEVVIIDSFSHEYDGEGGIVDWADELAEGTPKPGIANPRKPNDGDGWKDWLVKPVTSPGNWKEPKLAHKKMMNALLQCRANLIFCLRAEEKIEIVKDEKGRTQVRPLGWMPICEKRFMYEMTASFTLTPDKPGIIRMDLPHKVQEQHRAIFRAGQRIDETAGQALNQWAAGSAATAPPKKGVEPPHDEDGVIHDDDDNANLLTPSERAHIDALYKAGEEAANNGTDALQDWFTALPKVDKADAKDMFLDDLKKIAEKH